MEESMGRMGAGLACSPPCPRLGMITERAESSGDAPSTAPAGGREGQRGTRAPGGWRQSSSCPGGALGNKEASLLVDFPPGPVWVKVQLVMV